MVGSRRRWLLSKRALSYATPLMTGSDPTKADLIPHDLPFNSHLGIRLERREGERFLYRLPFRDNLVGDPERGLLFGGVLFALLDYALGAACAQAVAPDRVVATIDLRLDYARGNDPGRDVLAFGECYRLTQQIAFARGTAFHAQEEAPLASAQGTFMIYDAPPEWREQQR